MVTNVKSLTFPLKIGSFEYDVTVVEMEDHPFVSYWVKVGNLINAVTKSGDRYQVYGVGAKKYSEQISEAIEEFKYRQIELETQDFGDKVEERPSKNAPKTAGSKLIDANQVKINYWLEILSTGSSADKLKAKERLSELTGGKKRKTYGIKLGVFRNERS